MVIGRTPPQDSGGLNWLKSKQLTNFRAFRDDSIHLTSPRE